MKKLFLTLCLLSVVVLGACESKETKEMTLVGQWQTSDAKSLEFYRDGTYNLSMPGPGGKVILEGRYQQHDGNKIELRSTDVVVDTMRYAIGPEGFIVIQGALKGNTFYLKLPESFDKFGRPRSETLAFTKIK
jgi:hypothetical protein